VPAGWARSNPSRMNGRLKVMVRLVRRVCMSVSFLVWAAQGEGIKPPPAANLQSLVAVATTDRVSRSAGGGTAQTGPASDRTGMDSCQVDVTLSPSHFTVVLRVSFLRTNSLSEVDARRRPGCNMPLPLGRK